MKAACSFTKCSALDSRMPSEWCSGQWIDNKITVHRYNIRVCTTVRDFAQGRLVYIHGIDGALWRKNACQGACKRAGATTEIGPLLICSIANAGVGQHVYSMFVLHERIY